MLKEEIWNKWKPNSNLSNKYYVDSISDAEDFVIELSDEQGNKIKLLWDCIVESYMCTDEINRTRDYYSNEKLTKWTFFEVQNSKYICWLHYKSIGILDIESVKHFCIIGINSVVDIVALDFPIIV